MKNLSVIIITRNESSDIGRCLESLKDIASEIVVVDDFSEDNTVQIAGRYTNRIFQNKFESYGGQKQFALEKASLGWVLNVDADEVVSPGLKNEIEKILRSPGDYAGFMIPFRVVFLGRMLRFGSSAGEKHLRLFFKSRGCYGSKTVHEGVFVDGRIGRLKNYIEHYSYAGLDEYFDKFNRYTTLIAKEKHENGERFSVFQMARLPVEFVNRYFLKLGFLDGWHGFLYALLASFYSTVKYLKLWDMQRRLRR